LKKKAKHVASLFFVLIVLGVILKERNNFLNYFAEAGLIALTLNVTMMTLAYLLARLTRLKGAQTKAITLECGLQNVTLAILIAMTFLNNTVMAIPGAVYSLIMFATSGVFVFWVSRPDPQPSRMTHHLSGMASPSIKGF